MAGEPQEGWISMFDSIAKDIRGLMLFDGVAEPTLRHLMRAGYDQSFPPMVTLIDEGQPATFLHILVEGMVELYARAEAREATMAVLRPVSTFILAASIRDQPYLMSARTVQRSRVLMIPSADLRVALSADIRFANNVMNDLAGCYRSMSRHAKTLKLRNSRERIAAYLLRQSRLLGHAPGYTLPVEKRLLASYLGMTPENLSRALKSLAEDGCKVDGQRVIITNRARLTALARPSLLLDGPDADAAQAGVSLPLPRSDPTVV